MAGVSGRLQNVEPSTDSNPSRVAGFSRSRHALPPPWFHHRTSIHLLLFLLGWFAVRADELGHPVLRVFGPEDYRGHFETWSPVLDRDGVL